MIRHVLYTACLLIAVTPASAQSVPERLGINSFFGISPSTQDFVNEVALNEMLEIELSILAQQKGDAKTKEFAAIIRRDHSATSAHLKALVQSGKVRVSFPAALDRARLAKLEKIKGLNGAEFDKAFEDLQVSIHHDAVSLFERYGRGGGHPDLKVFAFEHLPHLREHWRLARDLKKQQ
jgi:putative membrane protein